jgi:hypothetical protein
MPTKIMVSKKRWIKTFDGDVVEAGPEANGTLLLAEGQEVTEEQAKELGIPFSEEEEAKDDDASEADADDDDESEEGTEESESEDSDEDDEDSETKKKPSKKPWAKKKKSAKPLSL